MTGIRDQGALAQGNSDPSRTEGVHLPPAGDFMEDFANFCHAECNERSLPWMLRSFAALRMTKRKELERQVEKRNLTYVRSFAALRMAKRKELERQVDMRNLTHVRSFASLRMTTKQDVARNAPDLRTPPFTSSDGETLPHTLHPLPGEGKKRGTLSRADEGNRSQRKVSSTADAQCLRRRNPLQGLPCPGEGASRRGWEWGVGGGFLHRTSGTLSRAGGYVNSLLVILCLVLLFIAVSPVVGQVPTTRLFFNPTPLLINTTISPNGVVNVEVADGVDIFAFDLFVHYDPTLLRVSHVAVGDFLGVGLDFGVSGSGVLLELTFEALGQGGDTPLSLTGSVLYDWPDVQPVVLNLEDGAVSVRPFRTYIPLILSASGQGLEVLP